MHYLFYGRKLRLYWLFERSRRNIFWTNENKQLEVVFPHLKKLIHLIKVASIQQQRMQVYFIDNEEYFPRRQLKFFDNFFSWITRSYYCSRTTTFRICTTIDLENLQPLQYSQFYCEQKRSFFLDSHFLR